jgi:enamine deaminase RidA (YjgF/YER057c/UK114 family)
MIKILGCLSISLIVTSEASAQARREIPLPPSQNPTGAVLPIAGAVWIGNTLYVSGWLDPDMKAHTDAKSQTVGILDDIKKLLESQGLSMGDVVMLRVYLGGELGKPDAAGMTAGYTQFFGTKDQPHIPARTTLQVVLPAAVRGALVEMDLVAEKAK